MQGEFDPYYKWLAIPPQEQPANHYRLLGVALFESDSEVIESGADRQMAHVRTFQIGRHSQHSQELLNVLSAAKVCLLKPEQKAAYDQELRRKLDATAPTAAPQPPSMPETVPSLAELTVRPLPVAIDSPSNVTSSQTRRPAPKTASFPRSSSILWMTTAVAALILLVACWLLWPPTLRLDERHKATERLAKQPTDIPSPANPMEKPSRTETSTPSTIQSTPPAGKLLPKQSPLPPTTVAVQSTPQPTSSPLAQSGNSPPPGVAPFSAEQAAAHQSTWAKKLETEVTTVNSVGMKMVLLPPGEFLMGSSDEQFQRAIADVRMAPSEQTRIRADEQPQHRVILTTPFRIGATEVTIGQFKSFVDATMYVTEHDRMLRAAPTYAKRETWNNPAWPVADDLPVNFVSRNDCIAFCNWLSAQENLPDCYVPEAGQWKLASAGGYRLPTEAEWEYACRAGTNTNFSSGDELPALKNISWSIENAENKAHPVGSKAPNAFGLYDLHGNLLEFCHDFFGRYEASDSQIDPLGPSTGSGQVLRGGGYGYLSLNCRSSARLHSPSYHRSAVHGFRVVRRFEAPSQLVGGGRTSSPSKDKDDVDLRVVQWVLGAAGTARVEIPNGRSVLISDTQRAPDPPFVVEAVMFQQAPAMTIAGMPKLRGLKGLKMVRFGNGTITDEGLLVLKSIKSLQRIDVSNSPVSDAGLTHLQDLPGLTSLNLNRTQITNQALAQLQTLPSLKELEIGGNGLTEEGLKQLTGMPKLESLALRELPISDAWLEQLVAMPGLRRLYLDKTKITSEGLKHVQRLSELQALHVAGTSVDDAGLRYIAGLPKLTSLSLAECPVTDAGLEMLQKCPKLLEIFLDRCQIGDAGLEHLKSLPELRILSVYDTKVTKEGAKKLKAALFHFNIRGP